MILRHGVHIALKRNRQTNYGRQAKQREGHLQTPRLSDPRTTRRAPGEGKEGRAVQSVSKRNLEAHVDRRRRDSAV